MLPFVWLQAIGMNLIVVPPLVKTIADNKACLRVDSSKRATGTGIVHNASSSASADGGIEDDNTILCTH